MRRLRSRLSGERGAIAVATALFMPLLFGAAAIAVDTAAVWSARQLVETGADAAVLAVTMDCAGGDCGDIRTTAQDAFFANDRAGKVSDLGAGVATITVSGRDVSVVQTTPWVINHFFAAALGYDTGSLTVASYASWAPAAHARAAVPLALSWCTYRSLSGQLGSHTPTRIALTTALSGSCSGPANGATVSAGTALTTVDGGSPCQTTSDWKSTTGQYGPAGLPPGCTGTYLSGLVGSDVVLPVFDAVGGSGSARTFRVYGYGAFHVTGYDGSSPALLGYFTYAAKQSDATTPPSTVAPDLGARSVFLTPTP
jgi:hypothetical protein